MKKLLGVNVKNMKTIMSYALFFTIFLTSCVTQSPLLEESDVHIDGQSYMYGNFESVNTKGSGPFAMTDTMRLIVENIDTNEVYSFLFVHSPEKLKTLGVPSGDYRIKEIETIKKNGLAGSSVHRRKTFESDWYNIEFEVKPNSAVYLGDFTCDVNRDSGRKLWNFGEITDTFAKTTEVVKENIPLFKNSNINFVSNMQEPLLDYFIHIDDLENVLSPDELKKYKDLIEAAYAE